MATPPNAELAVRLKQLRDALGLTQEKLASALTADKPIQAPTVSTWENPRHAASPPASRLDAYARLWATASRSGGPRLLPISDFDAVEPETYEDILVELTAIAEQNQSGATSEPEDHHPGLWDFADDGPLAIICPTAPADMRGPLANPEDPNYNETHGFADVDALMDIYGHILLQTGGRFAVSYRSAAHYRIEDLSAHLVLLGGIGWNELTKLLQPSLARLPVRQLEVPEFPTGEIFEVGSGDGLRRFLPEWSEDNDKILAQDIGYIARTTNPYNPHRTLTICNGVHSRGVLGAVRTLTDIRFQRENEAWLADHYPDGHFAVLIRVPVVQGKAIGVALSNPDSVLYAWPDAYA